MPEISRFFGIVIAMYYNEGPSIGSMGWFDRVTPRLVSATWLEDYRIRLEFDDGCVGVLDMGNHLSGEVFRPLRDQSLFRSFRLDQEWNTIAWPTGADLAPEYLYEQASNNPATGADREPGRATAKEPPERADDASLAALVGGSSAVSDADG